MKRLGVMLLAICRIVYCWMFLLWSLGSIYIVFINIRHLTQTSVGHRGAIGTSIIFTIYSVVFGVAWSVGVRGKPSLERWAFAANLIFIFLYVPTIVAGDWKGVLKDEIGFWPVILMGILGIIVFSIPHGGRGNRSRFPAKMFS